eukprot:SAG11_NODE_3399_length_2469_cov_4.036287_3_plen_138_part_00
MPHARAVLPAPYDSCATILCEVGCRCSALAWELHRQTFQWFYQLADGAVVQAHRDVWGGAFGNLLGARGQCTATLSAPCLSRRGSLALGRMAARYTIVSATIRTPGLCRMCAGQSTVQNIYEYAGTPTSRGRLLQGW